MSKTAINENLISQSMGPTLPGEAEETQESVTYPDDTYGEQKGGPNLTYISVLVIFLILLSVGLAGVAFYYIDKFKKQDRDEKTKEGVLFEVRVPRGNEIEIGVAEKMFANLYGMGGAEGGWKKWITVNNSVSFEIVGLPGEIRFYVYAPKKLANLVEKQVLGSYQDAEVRIVDEYNIFREDGKVSYTSLVLTDEPYYPIKTEEDFTGDPLANILSTLSKLSEGEGVLIQVVLSPAGKDWQKDGRGFVEKVEKNNADPEKDRIHVSQEEMEGISKKTSKVGFNTAVRVVTCASTKEVADMNLSNIVGAFDQFANPGLNEFKKEKINRLNEREFMNDVLYRRMPMSPPVKLLGKVFSKYFFNTGTILNVEELAAIYHLPNEEVSTPNIHWLLARDLPADNKISSDINSKDTIWIGNNIYRGVRKPICYKREDRRRHAYVVGQTGSGKSWLLVRMMIQDIYNGDGICFMDPHGSTAEMLLDRIPHERVEDVIYFNAADYERPIGFNIMEFHSEEEKHLIVNSFLDLMKKMFDPNNQGMTGPIFERAIRNTMLTAMSEEGSTLLEVLRILTDEDWVKEKWIPIIKDDLVKRYWTDQMAKTSDFHKSETLGYITSKLDRFVTNKSIRNIIAQSKSSFNLREAMDSGKIIVINLAKGLIGDFNAQFLGLLIMPKIVAAALSREDVPEEQRRDFFLFVDEFQNFATDEFASILSEARKYRLNLTVANQYIAQLPEDVKGAVFGNVGTLMIGRTGPEDADFLQPQFEPHLSVQDLVNQPNIHYYAKMIADGKYPAPFSLDPSWGSAFPESGFDLPVNKEISDLIKHISRLRYGRDVNLVNEEISQRAELATRGSDKDDANMGLGGGIPKLGKK